MPTETIVIEFQSNVEGLVKAEAAIDGVDAAGKNLATDFKKGSEAMNASMANTSGNAEKLSSSLKDVSKNAQFNNAKDQLNKFGTEVNETVGKSQRLTTQLRAMKQQLSEMDQAGLRGTSTFNKLAREAGKLEDQIGDTSKRIRALASDTKNIDAVVGVVSGLAGAFSAAQGAAALLGGENENLQKALLKVQAAMALATGVQQVANTLQKESAARIGILTAAQSAYALVVGTSTGALKIFRIALAATGVGLFALAIGAIVENFDKIKAKVIEIFPIFAHLGDVFIVIKSIFFGAVAAFVDGLSGIGKALSALVRGQLTEAKDAFNKINLKKAYNDEFKATYDAAAKAVADGSDKVVEQVKIGGEKIKKEVKRQQEEINDIRSGGVSAIPGDVSNIPEVVLSADIEAAKLKNEREAAELSKKIAQDKADAKRQLEIEALNFSIEMVGRLFAFGAAINAREIANLEEKHNRGVISEQKYHKQLSELRRKQAEHEKAQAIFSTIINTARAVVAALPNVALSIFSGALGLTELATIIAQPIPAFAKGTENVEGGTPGKDSVLAWLMPGERIVPTEINKQLGGIKNEDLPKLDFTPSLPNFDGIISAQNRFMQYGNKIDYDLLGKSVAKHMGNKLADIPRDVVNFDEKGVSKFIERGLSRTEIKSKRGNF